MRTTSRNPLFAILLLCATAACASGGGNGQVESLHAERSGMVEVTNDGHQDFVLYMQRDGMRYRLGRVARMETARFRIPAPEQPVSSRVQLVAEPLGTGAPFSTSTILWEPGQDLRGRVGRNHAMTNFVLVTR